MRLVTRKTSFRWSLILLAGLAGVVLCMTQRPSPSHIKKPSNRLISEKSPYLLQHAHNPVDWYPWGEEAFARARKENKPTFLSIGYSTCHWCHVMEKESFEDPEVARLMNERFVSIKVDREERPDIDNIYMTVCQMLTGRGGWPLTIIMTPDKKPFYAGTYFPKESRFGLIGMLDLVPRISDLWKTRADEARESGDKIAAALQSASPMTAGEDLDAAALKATYEKLSGHFDETYAGFGQAPKFPTPHKILFLLRYWKRSGEAKALQMAERTLSAMRRGGLYDHVGYGFHRYSTDAQWLVVHFEKMLYDQALLAMAYGEAYQATANPLFAATAQEIFTYVLRDMTAAEGGFYSAEDADSEGEEGKFYLWTEAEIRRLLKPEEADLAAPVFGLEIEGNFSEPGGKPKTGANILHRKKSAAELAADLQMSEAVLRQKLETIRQKLFSTRRQRVPPHKDDKILTDWNGLMIAALAKGAQVFDEPKYQEAAARAADFILKRLRQSNGRLWHRYRDGQAAQPAHIDDYAFLIWGLLELYEASFEVRYLQTALDLQRVLLKHYWDEKAGGFFFTADDGERLLARPKEVYDGAVPSGNSVAMLNLLRLGRITANPDFEKRAAQIGRAFSKNIMKAPFEHTQLMVAMDFAIGPSYEVVVAARSQAADTKAMLKALRTPFIPNKVVLFRPAEETLPEISRLAAYTKSQISLQGKATAYVCLNYNCKLPTTDAAKMLELFKP